MAKKTAGLMPPKHVIKARMRRVNALADTAVKTLKLIKQILKIEPDKAPLVLGKLKKLDNMADNLLSALRR